MEAVWRASPGASWLGCGRVPGRALQPAPGRSCTPQLPRPFQRIGAPGLVCGFLAAAAAESLAFRSKHQRSAGGSAPQRRRRRRRREEDLSENFSLTMQDESEACDCELILSTILEVDFLSARECDILISAADRTAARIGWGAEEHEMYKTKDVKVWEMKSPSALRVFREKIVEPMKGLIGQEFQLPLEDIAVDDAFIVKYSDDGQKSLRFHRDGSIVSAIVTLSPSSAYEGGGTIFDDGTLIRPEQGGGIIFGGQRLHGGESIADGTRYICTLFFKVGELSCRDEAVSRDDERQQDAQGRLADDSLDGLLSFGR